SEGTRLALPDPSLEVEIRLHQRVEVCVNVVGRAGSRLRFENGRARALGYAELDWHGLKFGISGADEAGGAAADFRALHQLDLGAVKVDVIFAVDRALIDVELPGHHHFAGGLERGWGLKNEPGLDKKTATNGKQENPPPPKQERFITIQPREKRSGPRRRGRSHGRRVHTTC